MEVLGNSVQRGECCCGLVYAADDSDDVADHRQFHGEWVAAVEHFGGVVANYAAREALKDTGRDLMQKARTGAELLAGAELVLRGWFDRSVWSAVRNGYWRLHPMLAEYIAMMPLEDSVYLASVALRKKYGRIQPTGDMAGAIWSPWAT